MSQLASEDTNEEILVHFTDQNGAVGIEEKGELGGRWGLYALPKNDADLIKHSVKAIRKATWVRFEELPVPIYIIPQPTVRRFRTPPLWGFVSAHRQRVRSLPLGSLELKKIEGRFIDSHQVYQATRFEAGRVMKRFRNVSTGAVECVFGKANLMDRALAWIHRFGTDWLPDLLLNGGLISLLYLGWEFVHSHYVIYGNSKSNSDTQP